MRFDLRPGVLRLFRLEPRNARQRDADIDEELEALIASRVESLVERGVTPDDARAEAARRLGASLDDARHQLHRNAHQRERRMRLHEHLETVLQDLRYAARGLARRPAFTAVAVLTLAIGIGATTAIFSAVNVLLLRPLPYGQPDELMNVSLVTPARPGRPSSDAMVWSYPKYRVFHDAQRVFSDLALYSGNQFTFSTTDPERVRGEFVGARYLRVLGLTPARGRDFEPSVDSVAGGVRQAILSYSLWNRRFNADPSIIGRTVAVDREPYVVIGIAPQFFNGLTGSADVFLPIKARDAGDLEQAQSHEFFMVARRAPGVTDAQAIAAVQTLGARLNDTFADALPPGARWGATARPLDAERLAPSMKRSLLVLFGAVGFVLLIACVNVANLLLGRANARRREIAVRLAIGAGRGRLVRLLLTESLLLALVGGVASVGVAWLGVRALNTINPAALRVTRDSGLGAMSLSAIALDWTTLGFTLGVAVVVGILFGMLPALHATRASLAGAIKDAPAGAGSRAGTSTSGRRALVVAEVALAIVLLAGSGLMLRSLTKLLAIDPGFDGRNVLTFRLNIPPGSIPRDSAPGFYAQLEERLHAIPGATDVGLANCAPLSGGCNATVMRRLDQPGTTLMQGAHVGIHWASATWFQTLHEPLLAGRLFNATDRPGSPRVVVINDATAKAVWPGENPIGKHIEVGQGGLSDAEVVGVVRGVRQRPDSAPVPEVYASLGQTARPGAIAFIRTQRDASSLGDEVRRAMHEVAPSIPIFDMQTMEARTAAATAQARFSATLLGLFALTALSLAGIGIYGVMALAVSARSRELGIRIALGADQRRVRRLVIGEGVALAASGAVIGLIAAFMATRVLRTMLYDLAPSDPATYAAVIVQLGGTAVAAAWLPARRAARVDPVEALRAD
jgi:predicted permease